MVPNKRIDEMSLPQIRRLVALHILGWVQKADSKNVLWYTAPGGDPDKSDRTLCAYWDEYRDNDNLYIVTDKMVSLGWDYSLEYRDYQKEYSAIFHKEAILGSAKSRESMQDAVFIAAISAINYKERKVTT